MRARDRIDRCLAEPWWTRDGAQAGLRFDPDAALRECRAAILAHNDHRAASIFAELDSFLRAGGIWPRDWTE